MSTIKEISESAVIVVIKPKEGILLSVSKDLITFSFLALCVYVSKDSNWWTLVTGIMFLIFMSGKITSAASRISSTFDTPSKAIKFLQKIEKDNDAE